MRCLYSVCIFIAVPPKQIGGNLKAILKNQEAENKIDQGSY